MTAPAGAAPLPAPPLAGPGHRVGVPLLRSFWRIRSLGTRNVPLAGPVILAGNHANFADGPLLFAFCPRPVRFLAKREMFTGAMGPIMRGFGHIPVDRGAADRSMITRSLEVLRAGEVLGVFPEGTRGSADFTAVHNGLAYLALRSGAPIVPVACLGTGARGTTIGALPSLRTRIDIVFGAAFTAADGDAGGRARRDVAAASERVRERLAAHLAEAERLTGRAATGPRA